MKLSIILGTFNRLGMLKACIKSIRKDLHISPGSQAPPMAKFDYEFVVADAGSTDGSREWLAAQHDVVLLGEWKREGAVAAFNKAYQLSRGEYILVINDDVELLQGSIEEQLERFADPDVGQIALAFTRSGSVEQAAIFNSHINKPYANLGIISRKVAEEVIAITHGLWTPLYWTYGADTELSCWVHRLGYKVLRAQEVVFHDKTPFDELRKGNYGERAEKDGKLFWSRWPDPQMLTPKGPLPLNLTKHEEETLKFREGWLKIHML